MSWSWCDDADAFWVKRRSSLQADESKNCLAWAAIARSKPGGNEPNPTRFLTFEEGSSAIAHAFLYPAEQHLILGAMTASQAGQLVTHLHTQDIAVRLVEGPCEAAQAFSEGWAEATGCAQEQQMDQGLYELTCVTMPDAAGGSLVPATEAYRENLHALVTGFCACFPDQHMTPARIERRVNRFLDERRAWLWRNRNHEIVSMAAVVRESPNTSSISWVYTPPKQRSQGYAERLVASLSQAQLDAGKQACNLHTDLQNSTSNGIYRRVGYTMIARSFRIRLLDGETPGDNHQVNR